MRLHSTPFALAALMLLLLDHAPAGAEVVQQARLERDGSMLLAGRQVRCENIRTRLDKHLPNLGAAALDQRLMVLNPLQLKRYSPTVQLFVYHHECGHHRVGEDELKADCWAVARGVSEAWLDARGLTQVCGSFENAPETATHPSAKRRCANLDRCFKAASERIAPTPPEHAAVAPPLPAQQQPAQSRQISQPVNGKGASTTTTSAAPKLIDEPRLLWSNSNR